MTAQSQTPAGLVEIRKYPNRRYYDTTRSRHLTLEDIRQLIRKGANVKIIDSQTGIDITSRTLTQMILEFDAPKLELFTVPLLTELIRVNDQVMKGFFEKFFHQALASFFTFQQHLERQLRAGSVLPRLFPVFPWMVQPEASSDDPTDKAEASPATGANGAELSQTVQQLQQQVAALERRLRTTKLKRPGKNPAGRPRQVGRRRE